MITQNLHIAASKGDQSAVQEQHQAGGDIDSESYAGITPLKLAIDSGNTKVISLLAIVNIFVSKWLVSV